MRGQLLFEAFDLDPVAVRGRFEWAVRNGNPSWLWPDIPVEQWRHALVCIETVTRQVLSEGRAAERLAGCAQAVGIAGYTSGMGPLLGLWLQQGRLAAEAEIAAILDLHLRHNSERMERMAERAVAIVAALAGRGIPVLVLKGMQTSYAHFPAPGARPLSDIDLAVRTGDRSRAGEVLRGLGLVAGPYSARPPQQQSWRRPEASELPRNLSFVHADDPWSVDLQTSLNRRYSSGSPLIELDRIWILEAIEPWALSPKGAAFAPAAQVLHLACHAGCGLGNLSLLRLSELVLVVRRAAREGSLDWDQFARLAELTGSLASSWPALHFSERLAPGTVPDEILKRGENRAPAAVLRVVRRLSPATCQGMLRWSLEERFMWTPAPWRIVQELARDLIAPEASAGAVLSIQKRRLFRLLRGSVDWRCRSSC